MIQPKKPLAKKPLATRQDSINLKNDSKRILEEYLSRGYIPTNKPFPSETLDESLEKIRNRTKTTELIKNSIRTTEKYNADDFRTPVSEYQYRQRESANGVLNMDITPALYDTRVTPTGRVNLMGQEGGTYNDGVSIPSYADIVISDPSMPKVTTPIIKKSDSVVPKRVLSPMIKDTVQDKRISPSRVSPYRESLEDNSDTLSPYKTGEMYVKNQGRLAMKTLAYGGDINSSYARLPSNKRHIAPSALVGSVGGMASMVPGVGTAVGAGLGIVSGIMAGNEAEAAEKERQRLLLEQQRAQDAITLDSYNTQGTSGLEYYASGGSLPQSSTTGKYNTTGGRLTPLNSTTEVAEGNTHGEKTIDGQYGITLDDGQAPIAEVEDEEVIKDGEKVYSNRLMFNKNQSFADKAKQIAVKTGKIETKLNDTSDTKDRNGLERSLAGMKMADEVLFNQQEQVKQREGLKELAELDQSPVMAKGGILPKYYYGTEDIDPQPRPTLLNNFNTNPIMSALPRLNPRGVSKSMYPSSGVNLNAPKPIMYSKSSLKEEDDPSFLSQLAPNLIDNVGNAILTANSPKLPSPILNRPVQLETTVDVNPELASIAQDTRGTEDMISRNSSNSNVARANIASARLRGLEAKTNVLARKDATERALRNQDVMSRNNTAMQNNEILRGQGANEFQRQVDLQGRVSGNLAELSSNIKDTMTRRDQDEYYNRVMLADLLDDPTREKVRTLGRNPELYKASKAFKKALSREALRKGNISS